MGGSHSRSQTRPPTPFNPSFSVPATPPDLYLVTRNSPTLSQSLWENFQPDHLFPEGSTSMMNQNQFSPPQQPLNLDPNLLPQMGISPGPQSQQAPPHVRRNSQSGMMNSPPQPTVNGGMGYGIQPGIWQGNGFEPQQLHDPQGLSPSDSWSNTSAQAVPTTLNVEDW